MSIASCHYLKANFNRKLLLFILSESRRNCTSYKNIFFETERIQTNSIFSSFLSVLIPKCPKVSTACIAKWFHVTILIQTKNRKRSCALSFVKTSMNSKDRKLKKNFFIKPTGYRSLNYFLSLLFFQTNFDCSTGS